MALAFCAPCSAPSTGNARTVAGDPRDDRNPWGVATGAEWLGDYPRFNPMLKQAGVRWLRGFYEWQTIQPRPGEWNFAASDRLVENARANGLRLAGVFAYFAPWASADGGTRKFPIKDIRFWREYVAGMVARYHSDIKYWEVWNEFNGSFAVDGSPEIYAELVREASISAKKVDPTTKIGMSVANFDVRFLDAAIKAGAAGHFDYICVHPYEILAGLRDGGEPTFLNMTTTLRKMLDANKQPAGTPLWITEIGSLAPVKRDDVEDQAQVVALAKAYLLSIAAGFQRVFWFEARGPSYGNGKDFGLIRSDMTGRPSLDALGILAATLGPEPASAGWLDFGEGAYGFVFDNEGKAVLGAWAGAKREANIVFDGDVRLLSLKKGESRTLRAGEPLMLSEAPILIEDLPAALVEKARAQADKPYPWNAGHFGTAQAIALLGERNTENGVRQINRDTTVADRDGRRTNFSRPDKEGHYAYFWVDPQFTPFEARALEITAVVRRVATEKVAGMTIDYESTRGYVGSDYRSIAASDAWQEITWTIKDANFVGAWGWNFRLNGISSPNEFLIKEVRVRRAQ
ncbi:glycosyl hydrolase [Bradyrhizobium sp. WSM 1744]|uniref:Glycosyl hydrolase n=2 Tax=Bradyrhizobium archetypum TaxID=2721160 RepID=A0A7Y4H4U0_9BRAD|nr:glycosyl hydrolase [Bradyrhizobium archetypum]